MSGALVVNGPQLVDVPAAAVYALAPLIPRKPAGLAALRVAPAGAGLVALELLSNVLVARLVVAGTVARPLTLRGWALVDLKRRHPHAERLLVVDRGHYVALVAASESSSLVLLTTEPEAPLPALPADPVAVEPALAPVEMLVDPALLIAAATACRAADPGPVLVEMLDHPVLGVRLSPATSKTTRGAIALARMVESDGAAQS